MSYNTDSKFDTLDTLTLDLRDEMKRLESDLKNTIKDRDEEIVTRREIQRACDFNRKKYGEMDDIVTEMVSLAVGRLPEGLMSRIQKVRDERA